MSFEKLCRLFDKTSNYLIRVSRSAIVNVAYYNLSKNFVQLTIDLPMLNDITTVKTSDNKTTYETFKSDFIKAKELYRRYILMQKRITAYIGSLPFITVENDNQ